MFERITKNFLLIASLAIIFIIGSPTRITAQTVGAKEKSTTDDEVAKIIKTATLEVKGMTFPKLKISGDKSKTSEQSSCCRMGDSRYVTDKARIDLKLNGYTSSDKSESMQSSYSPPNSCWVISDYSHHMEADSGPKSVGFQTSPANYSYVSSDQYEDVFDKLSKYVGILNIMDKYKGDLKSELQKFVKNYSAYSLNIKSSHSTVVHKAKISGQGRMSGKQTHYVGYINVTETCCPVEIRDPKQLELSLKIWVDDVAKQLPKIKFNTSDKIKTTPIDVKKIEPKEKTEKPPIK